MRLQVALEAIGRPHVASVWTTVTMMGQSLLIGNAVVIPAINDARDERLERSRVTKDTLADSIERLLQRSRELEVSITVFVAQTFNLIRQMPKEEDLVFADFFGNLDARAIDGTEDQSAVQSELHVGST